MVGQDFLSGRSFWKTLIALGITLYILLLPLSNTQLHQLLLIKRASLSSPQPLTPPTHHPTNLTHLAFGLHTSVKTWPHRRGYIEAWWRPNRTRGYVYLDRAPPPKLLPWPQAAPPYRVAANLSDLARETKRRFLRCSQMVHTILELVEEEEEELRWVVLGDDDTIFFVDNLVDVLGGYDHRKNYYLGWHSETPWSNYLFSFDQAFGGGGIVLSYTLAKALAMDMDGCLRRPYVDFVDFMIMACLADIGVTLTPHHGFHQVDLHGDISGFLSAHPKVPVISLHHLGAAHPIFPHKDRFESTRHLMKAAKADQLRLFQQTICHLRQTNWSLSISWGYSAQIYERIMPRSYLQLPLLTFSPWTAMKKTPHLMFNTRHPGNDPCESPHFFFFESVYKEISGDRIFTTYSRARPRGLPACSNHSADSISTIHVFTPAKKRLHVMDRCECCDIVRVDAGKAEVNFRECGMTEIIA